MISITCPKLLTIGQMARSIHVTVGWLREEAEAGRVPCLKADKRFLFDRDAVISALAERAAVERVKPEVKR